MSQAPIPSAISADESAVEVFAFPTAQVAAAPDTGSQGYPFAVETVASVA